MCQVSAQYVTTAQRLDSVVDLILGDTSIKTRITEDAAEKKHTIKVDMHVVLVMR